MMADHSQEECALHPSKILPVVLMQGMTEQWRAVERESVLPGMRADARFRGVATSPMWGGGGGGGGDHKEFQCQEGRGTMGQQSLSSRGTAVVNAITRSGSHLVFSTLPVPVVCSLVSATPGGLWFLVGLHLLSSSRSAVYWYSPDPVRAICDITPTHHIHITRVLGKHIHPAHTFYDIMLQMTWYALNERHNEYA